MSKFSLIISIVPHDKGEKLTKAAVNAGCGGGSVMMGRALAKSNFGAILGTGETTKDLIFMVVESTKKSAIMNAIYESTQNEKTNFGEIFTLDVDSLLKAGANSEGEKKMSENENKETSRDMITVIVNKGYADDVMFAARKAGATGGTVINARGTAREDDAKFFGVHIVPEKDMLVIVVEHDKKEAVLSAIKEVKCLKEPGMGIAFCSPVTDFELLGKRK
ncbi:MAG: P-II family nitrogen regulator [Treponema sp.]|uniref:P-II family nitrogen regulator n=1 Tax=Treponema sp. TaxID=166 RepID=UPI002A915A08|nr:P-II family nitrogen regulator [Treponema sp.]MDY6396715.1 P-II family nitrogen regulator [Treponema sp.]